MERRLSQTWNSLRCSFSPVQSFYGYIQQFLRRRSSNPKKNILFNWPPSLFICDPERDAYTVNAFILLALLIVEKRMRGNASAKNKPVYVSRDFLNKMYKNKFMWHKEALLYFSWGKIWQSSWYQWVSQKVLDTEGWTLGSTFLLCPPYFLHMFGPTEVQKFFL